MKYLPLCIFLTGCLTMPESLARPSKINIEYTNTQEPAGDKEGDFKRTTSLRIDGRVAAGVDIKKALAFAQSTSADGSSTVGLNTDGKANTVDQGAQIVQFAETKAEMISAGIKGTWDMLTEIAPELAAKHAARLATIENPHTLLQELTTLATSIFNVSPTN